MSLVAGIDYSTHAIDVVLIDEDTLKPEWWRYPLKGADAWERTRDIGWAFDENWDWDDVLAVGIEEPRGYNSGPLYRVQGAILRCIPDYEQPRRLVQPWIPSEWRKAVGLKGNASKEAIASHVRNHMLHMLGTIYSTRELRAIWDWPQDACDAYCIARATLGAIERSSE
jgi:hypothetical protein